MSLTAITSFESARIKFFMKSTYVMSRRKESNVSGPGGGKESNRHYILQIGEMKIFHELDLHHFYRVGVPSFWPQEAEMSLKAVISFESARR